MFAFAANTRPELPLARSVYHWPAACLIELSARHASACLSVTATLLVDTQSRGELTAWVQPEGGSLFPPDLHASGVDLRALVVVHIPGARNALQQHAKAAELLLRSGAFGTVVIDLCDLQAAAFDSRWQQRLLGLVREHHCRVALLTRKTSVTPSLGPLVSLRLQPERQRLAPGLFTLHCRTLKNKSGHALPPDTLRRGPWGLI